MTVIAILLLIGLALIFRKPFSAWCVVFSVAALLLSVLWVVNTTTEIRKITPSEAVLEAVATVAWDDGKTLNQLGFDTLDGKYVAHYDSEKHLCSIVVSVKDPPKKLRKYGEVGYTAETHGLGALDRRRLRKEEVSITRHYAFYINGREIRVIEDTFEKAPYAFEEFMLSLVS